MKSAAVLAALCAAALFAASCAARADSSVVMMVDTGTLRPSTGSAGAIRHTPDLFGTGDHASDERQDMSIYSPTKLHLVALLLCDKGVYITMDPARGLYASVPIADAPIDLLGINSFQYLLDPSGRNPSLKTGATTVHVTVKDLGMSKPPGMQTRGHEYSVDSHEVSTGAAGQSDTDTHATLWIDSAMRRFACPDVYKPSRTILAPSGARISYTVTGDVAKYEAICHYLPLMIRLAAGGHLLIFRQENASSAPLAVNLFAVPSGFKRVSLEQLSQVETNVANSAGPRAPGAAPLPPVQ